VVIQVVWKEYLNSTGKQSFGEIWKNTLFAGLFENNFENNT
jgi:hypothetical protein